MAAMLNEPPAVTRKLPLWQPLRLAEVIVVGGGLAGIQAALDIQEAGLNCMLLESEADSTSELSQGCLNSTLVDSAKHPQTVKLLKSFGVDLPESECAGTTLELPSLISDASALCEADQRSLNRVRDNLQGLSQGLDVNKPSKLLPNYGTMSVHELVVSHGATERVRGMTNQWVMAIFGLSSNEVSAIYFLLYCKSWGGFVEVLSEMTSSNSSRYNGKLYRSLSNGLRSKLQPGSTVFSQPVVQIHQSSESECSLTTSSGDVFYCSKVILAVPTLSYQAIDFQPNLSEDKRWLQTHSMEPCILKTTLVYERPWWQEMSISEQASGLDGAICIAEDMTAEMDGTYGLSCIIGGKMGQTLRASSEEDRQTAIMEQLQNRYGSGVPTPILFIESGNVFPCLAVPATRLRNLERDQWQPEGSIHFIGADTSYSWRGHVEGCLVSASRGAKEVIDALCSDATGIPVARL